MENLIFCAVLILESVEITGTLVQNAWKKEVFQKIPKHLCGCKKINVVNFRGKYLDARFLSIPDRKCTPEDEDKNENENRKRRPKPNLSY